MSDTRNVGANAQTDMVETLNFEPIKGYPMLQWRGKRPFTSTHFYPAQLKEQHGSDVDGWQNKIYWGDNLQVMSHMLKRYRGQVKLVYIDPPFDSKADYKKRIQLRGHEVLSNATTFEEKQYTDIWSNDEYLQFMYERIVILRELLSDDGIIFLHCDTGKAHHLRALLDEIFGPSRFVNQIIWKRQTAHSDIGQGSRHLGKIHDIIFLYSKGDNFSWNMQYQPYSEDHIKSFYKHIESETGRRFGLSDTTAPGGASKGNPRYEFLGITRYWRFSESRMEELYQQGKIVQTKPGTVPRQKRYLDEMPGIPLQDIWTDINMVQPQAAERLNYPTQKPEQLIERIIKIASNPGDIVFDCFMGSGTTQAVAMKLGRRFLGADINLGAIQIATKRLIYAAERILHNPMVVSKKVLPLVLDIEVDDTESEAEETEVKPEASTFYLGFEVYNVNNYEIFRNPVEAKDLLIEALELQKLQAGHLFDGERDGRMWKIMPVNKIATRQDLNEIISGLNLRALAARLNATPNQPAEKITLVCMGHEPDLAATLNQEVALSLNVKAGAKVPLDVQVFDILRDRGDLQFKRDSEARVSIQGDQLVIEAFYPMNLLSKLSLEKERVGDWREMVDSVMVDFNYDGAVFNPNFLDIPEKNVLVSGSYTVPADAGTIRVKITDVLSESLEIEIRG